jgi:hypothetical protein
METAELIAKETGAKIVPTPWMQEIFGERDIVDTYRGSTIDELKKYYFGISEDASLDYPWWVKEPENHEMVKERVGPSSQVNRVIWKTERTCITCAGPFLYIQ